ncbi:MULTISPECIES: TetR/AcrR family transcriptional regulator [Nocardiaceae]|nr:MULTISPECIES: TetR/AcrR family transcriptional regulator [Rhodococcus]
MARIADPDVGQRLLDAALRLLVRDGSGSLSTRRIATEAGTSAMAVYTHYGSIGGLIGAVIERGFADLASDMSAVGTTADPVRDLVALLLSSVRFAREQPNIYEILFVTSNLGQYRRTAPAELTAGRDSTLQLVVDCCERARAAGRFRSRSNGVALAYQWWSVSHGYILLELAGYAERESGTRKVLAPLLEAVAVGLGDDPVRTQSSLDAVLVLAGSDSRHD